MYNSSHLSSIFKTFTDAIDNAARCNCYVDSNKIKEPVYVLIEGTDDRKFVRVPIESTVDIRNTKYDTQYTKFDKNPMFPVCMDSYYRGVSPDFSQNLIAPPSPSMSSMRAKAKLQEAKDFRKAMEYVRDNIDLTDDVCIYDKDSHKNIKDMRFKNTLKERLDSVDLDSNCDGQNIYELLKDPANEDAINNLTYEEEQLLLHLMTDSEIKTITDLIGEPTEKDDKIVSTLIEEITKREDKLVSNLIKEPTKDNKNIFDLIQDPSNEVAINNLTYEEEMQLLQLMNDSERKIVTELIEDPSLLPLINASERKIVTDLIQTPANEDDSTTLTHDEEWQLLHLMEDLIEEPTNEDDKKITDLIEEPTNEDDKTITDLIEEPTNKDDKTITDLIEEPTNEDDEIVTDLIEEPTNEDDKTITDLNEEPTNEDEEIVTDLIEEQINEDDEIVTDLIEEQINEDDEIVTDLIEEHIDEDDEIVTDLIKEPTNEDDKTITDLIEETSNEDEDIVTDLIEEQINEDDEIVTDLFEESTNEDDEIITVLIEEPTNEDDEIITVLIEQPTNEEDEILTVQIEEPIIEDNEIVTDLIQDSFNEEDSNSLTYEDELQLLHLMDDSGKIIFEEEFESVVGANVESLQSINENDFKTIDESLIKQCYLILENASQTNDICI